ncbi:MAG: hypothetical protein CMJ80_01280 [Planctomycetaceae bacterium]|nr:hypothetical protein [Planctomycetaceae bacterium]
MPGSGPAAYTNLGNGGRPTRNQHHISRQPQRHQRLMMSIIMTADDTPKQHQGNYRKGELHLDAFTFPKKPTTESVHGDPHKS